MMDVVTLLKEKNLTVTPQRVEIMNILSSRGHINIDELYKLVHISFPSISLATVYKNINIMLEKLLLSEVQIPSKKNVYEIRKDEHAHVTCTSCDAIMDIDLQADDVISQVQEKSGFTLNSSSMIFSGVCQSCSGFK